VVGVVVEAIVTFVKWLLLSLFSRE